MVSKNIRTIIFIVVILSLLVIGYLLAVYIIKKRSMEGFMQTKFDQESVIVSQLNKNPFYLVYVDNTNKFKQIYIKKTGNMYEYSIDNQNTYNIIYNIELTKTSLLNYKEPDLKYILKINIDNTEPSDYNLVYRHTNGESPQFLGRSIPLAKEITKKIAEIKEFITNNQSTTSTAPALVTLTGNVDSAGAGAGVSGAGAGVSGAGAGVVENNTINIRDSIKSILSLRQIDSGNGQKDGIMNNMIILTRKINDPINDIIGGYDIEAEGNQKTIESLKEKTGNKNIGEFISKIRMIGSDSRDYTSVNRDADFYLNMANGVSIDIKFTDNYINNFSAEINTDTSVNELLPTNFVGTDEDKKGYKSYRFKTATIYVIKESDTHAITIDYYKETDVSDVYLDMLNKGLSVTNTNKCKKIFATQNIIITLILKSGTLNTSINDETFKGLIEKIDIPSSELSYKLGFKYIKENGQEIISTNGIYKVDLYIENITFKTQSMNLWLENAINNINNETLDNQLDEIITPMFDMDNEIDKRDKIVKRVRDIYRFNKLSNSQNNMRFYNSHY